MFKCMSGGASKWQNTESY